MRRDVTAPVSWHVGAVSVVGIVLTVAAAPVAAWFLTGALVAGAFRKWGPL